MTSPFGSLERSFRAVQRQASQGSSKGADGGNERKLWLFCRLRGTRTVVIARDVPFTRLLAG